MMPEEPVAGRFEERAARISPPKDIARLRDDTAEPTVPDKVRETSNP